MNDAMGQAPSTDALLDVIAERGFNVSLDGPDVTIINPEYRWTLRCYTNERDPYGTPVDRKMFHGASARDVLSQAIAWSYERVQREGDE